MSLLLFLVLSGLFTVFCWYSYHKDLRVFVQHDAVAWDGSIMYPPGQHEIPYGYEIVFLKPRITYFGQDESGKVHVIPPEDKTYLSFERKPDLPNFRKRIAIEWQPDEKNILTFLKSGDVKQKIAELLSVNLRVDLSKYAEKFGMIILNTEGLGKQSGSVELGDGVEIPY